MARNVIACVTFDGRFLLFTNNCKGLFHMALTVSLSGCVVPFKHQLYISFKNPLINPVNT
ncbi:TPA: hypothetical protein MJA60_25895 [Klebsiella pneumoniae]|nr:hypothetical protein [Klebsiella pneumoniae]HBZ0070405.1 hypothetical protein [Klebsiella pneumoniae subsp. ozaenae]HBY9763415.1 hypothetical protein [Klebsiella pneumoniae]HBY9768359.1 hypothetical protein [Klebsiella pneumoniae]HBY9778013.1 hypothetical protein [Klebsiella pneumoniae]